MNIFGLKLNRKRKLKANKQNKGKKKKDSNYYCVNSECPAKAIEKLIHYVSRDAMNIEGIRDQISAQFYDELGITEPSELYSLTEENLLKLDKFKEK